MEKSVTEDFGWFSKVINNARSPSRGKELVFVTPQTFASIDKPPLEKNKNRRHRARMLAIRNTLWLLYGYGLRFCEINPESVSRQAVSRYLNMLVKKNSIDAGGRRITLNSVFTSGRMQRIALSYNFDLYHELKHFNIPIV